MKTLVALGLLSIAVAVPAKAVQHTVSHPTAVHPPASHPPAVHAQNPYLTHANHKKAHRHHK